VIANNHYKGKGVANALMLKVHAQRTACTRPKCRIRDLPGRSGRFRPEPDHQFAEGTAFLLTASR